MNIEQLWMVSKAWYFEGGRKNREWEEVMAYLVGVEGAIKVAYESLGKYSKAVLRQRPLYRS